MVVVFFLILFSIRKMKDEVDRNLNKIYFDKHNPYFTKEDKTLNENHPKRIFTVRQSGYLNSDDLEKDSDLNKFYDLEEMLKFVSDSLEAGDPLAKIHIALCIQTIIFLGTLMEMNLL